jgi:hypothetical protein
MFSNKFSEPFANAINLSKTGGAGRWMVMKPFILLHRTGPPDGRRSVAPIPLVNTRASET